MPTPLPRNSDRKHPRVCFRTAKSAVRYGLDIYPNVTHLTLPPQNLHSFYRMKRLSLLVRLKSEVSSWHGEIKIVIYGCEDGRTKVSTLIVLLHWWVGRGRVNSRGWSPVSNILSVDNRGGKVECEAWDRHRKKLTMHGPSEFSRVCKFMLSNFHVSFKIRLA